LYIRVVSHLSLRSAGLILASLGAGADAFALSGPEVATQHVTARLISESASIGPGQTVWVSLELDIRDGWHTYWRNPGDSGLATHLTWDLPSGFTAADIQWAAPHRFDLAPLVNFGYSARAEHLVRITAPASLHTGPPVTLSAKADWLVCSTVCIPESARLQLKLPAVASAGAADPTVSDLFSNARREVPMAAAGTTTARQDHGRLIIRVGNDWGTPLSQITAMTFFPYDEGVVDYAAPQILAHTADGLELTLVPGPQVRKARSVRGVLMTMQQRGAQSVGVPYEVSAGL
jgi:DsbC/DsbD-like thiol-disulfide interchange protein